LLSLFGGFPYSVSVAKEFPPQIIELLSKPEIWRVESIGTTQIAQAEDPSDGKILIEVPLQIQGAGVGEVIDGSQAPGHSAIFVLRYFAGTVGTSERVAVIRSAVFRWSAPTGLPELLGDEVSGWVDEHDWKLPKGTQPRWVWGDDHVSIESNTVRRLSLTAADAGAPRPGAVPQVMVINPADAPAFRDAGFEVRVMEPEAPGAKAKPARELPWLPSLMDRTAVLKQVPDLERTMQKLGWHDLDIDKFLALCSSEKLSADDLRKRYPEVPKEVITRSVTLTRSMAQKKRTR